MHVYIKWLTILAVPAILIVWSGSLLARESGPETPIDIILDLETELELTVLQTDELIRVNKDITDQMIRLHRQADTRKTILCDLSSKGSNKLETINDDIIYGYYKYLIEMKLLELDAIVKARKILTKAQLELLAEITESNQIELKLDCFTQCCN